MRTGKFLRASSIGLVAGTIGNLFGLLLKTSPELRGLALVLTLAVILALGIFGFLLDEKTAEWLALDIEVVHVGSAILLALFVLSGLWSVGNA
jgi:hypothetical protein